MNGSKVKHFVFIVLQFLKQFVSNLGGLEETNLSCESREVYSEAFSSNLFQSDSFRNWVGRSFLRTNETTRHMPAKNLLVADAGGTSIDWMWEDGQGRCILHSTQGFNPTYADTSQLAQIARSELKPQLPGWPHGTLFFYGAGCREPEIALRVANTLEEVFPNLEIRVSNDMLGAARATAGTEEAIVCILGTGSNSMRYDGKAPADQIPNLGMWLGDEGSGGHMGRELLRAWFYREMPPALDADMRQALPEGRKTLLAKAYQQPQAAAWLASFTTVLLKHRELPQVQRLIRDCLEEFLRRHVCKYEGHGELPVHFVGSVAAVFEDELTHALQLLGLRKGRILRKPIEALFDFHRKAASSHPI